MGRPDSALDPELAAAIRAVPAWAGRELEAVVALPGGLTNRNFRVDLGGAAYVVRVPGAHTALLGIDRQAEWEATRAAAAAGVGPEPVAFLPGPGILVTRFIAADPLPPEALGRHEVLAAVVAAIRTLHSMPAIPSRFSPFRVVREYGRMGDPFFDLGNFAVNHDLTEEAQQAVLARYAGRVSDRSLARLRLMGIVSDFREAMWGVVQQGLSSLSVDYRAHAERHFERGLRASRDPRYRSWLAAAASDAAR